MKCRRGMARLLEAVVAAIIVATALSVSYFYLLPTNPYVIRGGTDLEKYGFDTLNTLARQGGFDRVIFDASGEIVPNWDQQMRVVLGSIFPTGILFNMTVYNSTVNVDRFVTLTPLPTNVSISNADASALLNAGQVSQVTFIYTTKYINAPGKGFYVLVFDLQLARATRI
jgi:hypothetical protein